MKTANISVSINPVSSRDTSGGTASTRISIYDEFGRVRNENDLIDAAIQRACERLYGKNTFWWADSGLRGYGQVMMPCKTGGASAVTYRAGLSTEFVKLPPGYTESLAEQNDSDAKFDSDMDQAYQSGQSAAFAGMPIPQTAGGAFEFEVERGYRDGLSDIQFEKNMIADGLAAAAEDAADLLRDAEFARDAANNQAAEIQTHKNELASIQRLAQENHQRKMLVRAHKLAEKYGSDNLSLKWKMVLQGGN